MAQRFTLDNGKVSFGSLEEKQHYMLDGLIRVIEYLGKESKLTRGENDLKKFAIKEAKKIRRTIKIPQ